MKKFVMIVWVAVLMPIVAYANLVEAARIAKQGNTSFGYSVDSDGDFVAVGAPEEEGGTVYVFQKNSLGELVQIDRIGKIADTPSAFGRDVAIKDFGDDGLYLAVGAPDFSQSTQWGTIYYDVVHIFERNTTTGKFDYFQTMYGNDGEGYGTAIDMAAFSEYTLSNSSGLPIIVTVDKGLLLLVGEANASNGDGGIVLFSYSFVSNDWKNIAISNSGTVSRYGYSVALTDDKIHPFFNGRSKIVVGAPDENLTDMLNNTYSKKGAVYVYELNATHADGFTLVKEEKLHQYVGLVLSGNAITQGSKFGTSVDIASDKSTLIVGALKKEIVSAFLQNEAPGAAYIYSLASGGQNQWELNTSLEQPADPSSKSEAFGSAVSIDEKGNAVVGAQIFVNPNGDTTGAVFSFVKTDGGWQAHGSYLGQSEGRVGTSVENFGDAVLCGDPESETLTLLKSVSFYPNIIMYLLD